MYACCYVVKQGTQRSSTRYELIEKVCFEKISFGKEHG